MIDDMFLSCEDIEDLDELVELAEAWEAEPVREYEVELPSPWVLGPEDLVSLL